MTISTNRFIATIVLVLVLSAPAKSAEKVTYYYTDEQGSPLVTVDSASGVAVATDYRPYGAQTVGVPQDAPGYTGHSTDADVGLVYMQARYYDPGIGRFLSVDPVFGELGNLFTPSVYVYGNDNPILNSDPSGMVCGGSGDVSPEVQRMRDTSDRCGGTGVQADIASYQLSQSVGRVSLPPTATDSEYRPILEAIAKVPAVSKEIEREWLASRPYDATGKKEHGMYISLNPATHMLSMRSFSSNRASGSSIIPGPKPLNAIVFFHTHPNDSAQGWIQGPSPPDRAFADSEHLPGIIESHSGMYYFGPPIPIR